MREREKAIKKPADKINAPTRRMFLCCRYKERTDQRYSKKGKIIFK